MLVALKRRIGAYIVALRLASSLDVARRDFGLAPEALGLGRLSMLFDKRAVAPIDQSSSSGYHP